jgi:hypothetical protein
MSTVHVDTRASAYSTLDNDSANALENGMGSSNPSRAITTNENNELTWTNSFAQWDRLLSGSLLHLCYRIIDIIILFIGLSSDKRICTLSSHLAVTSICLLVFYFIDIIIIAYSFIRNISPSYRRLTEEEKIERLRRVLAFRSFFTFFKLTPVCVGTGYALTSSSPTTNDCELMRFCLGIVCISTLLSIIIPPTKPEIPPRRTFILECFILSFVLIINGTYLCTVISPTCVINDPKDIYLGAPLKSYAYIGIILFGSTTAIHIINLFVSQLCNCIRNGRRFYSYYYILQYALGYFGALIVIYYFSIGALFLFKPRSGQPCRADAPDLYRTLLIWEWIRILFPLLAVPLILILCCLGVFFGIILSYCLPASITVPLLELVRVR